MAQFEITNPTPEKFQFTLRGPNRTVILHSTTPYTSLEDCLDAIRIIQLSTTASPEVASAEIVNFSIP